MLDTPAIRWNGHQIVITLPFFNSALDIFFRQNRRRGGHSSPTKNSPTLRVARARPRSQKYQDGRRFMVARSNYQRRQQRLIRFLHLLRGEWLRGLRRNVEPAAALAMHFYPASSDFKAKTGVRRKFFPSTRHSPKNEQTAANASSVTSALRLKRTNFKGFRPENQLFDAKFRSRFRRGRSSIGFFRSFFVHWIRLLHLEVRSSISPEIPIRLRLIHRTFNTVSARHLALYTVRRLRLNYRLNRIVFPLIAEARKSPNIKGLFFKFKGRLTRKARASLNTLVIRHGKIGFSTLDTKVDYSSVAFRTRYGTCSVQVWLAKRRSPAHRRKLLQGVRQIKNRWRFSRSLSTASPNYQTYPSFLNATATTFQKFGSVLGKLRRQIFRRKSFTSRLHNPVFGLKTKKKSHGAKS